MSSQVKVAVIGASGYSGRELLRLLLLHPHAEIVAVTSRALAGKPLVSEFPRFRGFPQAEALKFIAPDVAAIKALGATVAFLALPHGVAHEFATPLLDAGLKVIDLSADFRLRDASVYAEYYDHAHPSPALLGEAVYALPEWREDEIKKARLIACPGCYPTSVLVPLLPLLKAGLLDESPIAVSSMSGVSGAGRKESVSFLFCECNESVRAYSVPKHRHLSEIGQELDLAAGRKVRFTFVPHLIPVNQGIHTTIFAGLREGATIDDVGAAYASAYTGRPFVRLLGRNQCPDTKNITGTNFIDVGWAFDERAGRLILMSAEDNLVKGASGQAVQNFNLIHAFPEDTGLMVV
ncbi:N-acetyl-gamma-glutamyl-phosphate reductase [Roseimicrobium sp. ORNL1]|uniref:N-acetyl-gamma-glutamyl-phosphate reductase n=1 Tax=Roseimicrobium sp. ORNL1 TaxID=2711231 RepID=UPI0013E14B41|nr:N-acetyl-gamma-glutamyl-phosphate reductase [Roseimicrobium sp. ORNL1]QIF04589.1 N-acetyl-gamma-glutamyl-phosphate reductase [Roseimicrobium sp. ORNL1]